VQYLNTCLVKARKEGLDSFTWEVFRAPPPIDENEEVIETKFSGPFHQTVIDTVISLLTEGGYTIETFQSESIDLLRIKIIWANEEIPEEQKLNGSRRLRLTRSE
jgi:hypothetical protein